MEKSSCQICRLNLIGDGENTAQNVQTIYQSTQRICLLIYLCKRKRRYFDLAFTAYKIVKIRLKGAPAYIFTAGLSCFIQKGGGKFKPPILIRRVWQPADLKPCSQADLPTA